MSNLPYFNKLASDELKDTLFFATGEIPVLQKFADHSRILNAGPFEVKILRSNRILVNSDVCKSVPEAKYCLQQLLYDL